jgi:hypothetical protein
VKIENRKVVLIGLFVLLCALSVGMIQQEKKQTKSATPATYQGNILPMLKTNCTPCHFEGGKVFGKLPFTEYETVKTLGKKLNTRFGDKEKQEQRELVLSWVKAGSKEK